ncbi:NifB/NifX family molybdenum-iron cluster-binding protein [Pantoea sp. B65]|uniref:NifB/NifX family molybdenum-iron cluster-binding protein n=1 Tax=Pantoea sp. B65 TaxID=2813359 RepID=UPI0039B55F52
MNQDEILFWRVFALMHCLPELTPAQVVDWLGMEQEGALDVDQIARLPQAWLEARFPADRARLTAMRWRQIMACLRGELPAHLTLQPRQLTPATLLVAFASQDGVTINGHFGQSRLFFIYALDDSGAGLYDLRRWAGDTPGLESNETRVRLLEGCHLLFCESIGGPAAARVIRCNVHPVKAKPGTLITTQLQALQTMLTQQLPPWLARRLGKHNPLTQRVFS